MFTLNSNKWVVIFVTLMTMAILPGVGLAQGGDDAPANVVPLDVVTNANDHITALDNLRAMSSV